jgi:beta-phosphoglucomutase
VLHVETLAAPFTVNTMPDHTLAAFADHGTAGALPVSMEHTLVTEPDAAQLAVKAAGFMADRIRSAIAANGTFTCAVSGGQTPWLMLAELAEHDLPWSSVEIYQVDERVTPDGDPERNLTHLRQILGSLPVTLIPMPVTDPDLEAAAAAYASRLPARFDLVHLGLGADGHTASLVPGEPVLEVTDRLVAVTGPYQGHRRMTLTYPALARAEEAMWLVTGAGKHDALDRLLAGDRSIPAARVQARRSVIFADPPAVHGSRTFQGAIFDVDGVLVDSPHYRAWRDALQELMDTEWAGLRGQTSYCPERFTEAVYQQIIAGRPRLAGALAALEYFGVPGADRRAPLYAAVKQEHLVTLIEAGEFTAFADAIRFVLAVKAAGIPIAAASSSKNADLLLRQVSLDTYVAERGLTLLDLLDADVSGRDLPRGKPDPMIFLVAAEELPATPARCFVVEDAAVGVQAAKAGGMAALGVARLGDEQALADAGADLVVRTLDEVSRPALAEGRLARKTEG